MGRGCGDAGGAGRRGRERRVARAQYLLTAGGYVGALLLARRCSSAAGPLAFRLADEAAHGRAVLFAVAAGMIAMLLTAGLVATLLDWPGWWLGVTVMNSANAPPPPGLRAVHGVWLAMLALWAGWAWVFFRYARDRDHRTAAARLTRALLSGTVLELCSCRTAPCGRFSGTRRKPPSVIAPRSYTGCFSAAGLLAVGPCVSCWCLPEKRRGRNQPQPVSGWDDPLPYEEMTTQACDR